MKKYALNEKVLLAAGYRKYAPSAISQYANALFQKVLWVNASGAFVDPKAPDRDKKAFYINVSRYPARPEYDRPESFQTDVRFYAADGLSFDVELFPEREHTIEFIEAFYRRQYIINQCVPDAHNND